MTNTIKEKNKPYFQPYIKNDYVGHVRYKFVDSNGDVYIRGLNREKGLNMHNHAIYEKGETDKHGADINSFVYIPGDKFYLNSEQEDKVKKKIQDYDSNEKQLSYNVVNNNCVDFNHSVISEIDEKKSLEDFLNDNQKKIAASRGYNFTKYGHGKEIPLIAAQTLLSTSPVGGAPVAGELARETTKILQRKNLLTQQTPLPRTPEQEEKVKNIVSKITEHDDKRTDVLYKQPPDLTENEARSAMQLARYESNDIELNNRLEQKAKSYYDSLYSNKNLERDASGRQINPKPQYTPLTEPKELRTKDNILMREAYQSIAERTAQTGVKSLQRGLNSFPYQTPLKEDDDLGPKTTSRLKENLVTHGLDKTQESIKEDIAAREEAERKEREA